MKNASGGEASVATDAVETLTLNVDKVDADVDLDASTASITNLTINATGSASSFALTADNLTDLTVNAAAALTLTSFAGAGALENVSVTGAAAVNLGNITGNNGLKTFTSTNTAGVTVSIDTDTADVTGGITSYDFGSGADVVTTTDTTVDIAVDLGAGNDKITLATGTTTLAETIDGGDGTDTLVMAAANATTASATTTFETKITGFEKLEVGRVDAEGVVDVDMANMDDINYVITNGITASNPGSTETTIVTFQNLESGQSVTVAGLTLTAASYMTAVQVAEVFDSLANGTTGIANTTGTLTGWSTADNADQATVTFTASTAGPVDDLADSYSDANAAAPTALGINTTLEGAAATTETTVVTFSSLIGGEQTVVSDGTETITVTAKSAAKETATIDLQDALSGLSLAATDTVTIQGITLTIAAIDAADTASDITDDIAQAFVQASNGTLGDIIGANGNTITATGSLNAVGQEYNFTHNGAGIISAQSIVAEDATNLGGVQYIDVAGAGTQTFSFAPTITQGVDGGLTANEVAAIVADAADGAYGGANPDATVAVTGAFAAHTPVASTNTVTFTGTGDVANITVTNSGSITSHTNGVDATTESVTVTFQDLKSGQSISIGGITATANMADITAEDLENAFNNLANNAAANATVGLTLAGTLTGWTTDNNDGDDGIVVFTAAAAGVTTNIDAAGGYNAGTVAAAPTDATFNTTGTQGGQGATALGSLLISNMANNGTIELKGANAGFDTTVEMAAASATTLNVMIKDQSGTDLGNLEVDDVETIAITTTDTFTDTTGAVNEFGAAIADGTDDANSSATVEVTGDAVETVTVTGAGDLALTVTAATTLTAVNASTMTGALTYTANVAEMTVTGGSAADNITVAANTDEVVVNGGDGADTITINAGADLAVIDGGAGNDTFVIAGAASNKDSYAVFNNVASGDVFDFTGVSDFIAAKVTLATAATESTQAYLNQAITNLATGEMGWFQYNGNTFVVLDNSSSATTFTDGTDLVIMIAGLKDLSTGATFNADNGTLEII